MPSSPKRICDFCTKSAAILYCRADSAKLCLSCDKEVHETNPLFKKHKRFQLCDNCDEAPATMLCFTEHSVLCSNCDFERHKSLDGHSHDRRALEGFIGSPSVGEMLECFGFDECKEKELRRSVVDDGDHEKEKEREWSAGSLWGVGGGDEFDDLLAWDVPSVISLDDLISSTGKSHNFQAMVVPPMPKDRNCSCGQHKYEILRQLQEMSKSEPTVKQDLNFYISDFTPPLEDDKDFSVQHLFQDGMHDDHVHGAIRGHEARSCTWGGDADEGHEAADDLFLSSVLLGAQDEESILDSDRHSSISGSINLGTNGWNSQSPNETETFSVMTPRSAMHEFTSADRGSALSRYKEKKRTRRYDRHIRYESRKVQAEHRTRVKGRFAKIEHPVNQS